MLHETFGVVETSNLLNDRYPHRFKPKQGQAFDSLSKKLYTHCSVLDGTDSRVLISTQSN